MDWLLTMYWDRWDIVEAHYAHAVDYHSGMWSELYAKQCRISEYYSPGMGWAGYESLSENGQVIYDQLAERYS